MQPTSVLGRARCRVREESAPEAATRSPSTARLARVIAEEVVRVHRGSKGDNSALPSGKQPQPIAATGSGEPPGMYHRESAQEDFLVLWGECLLLVEGEERRLKAWDFVHCPPWTDHVFVGAGDGPCGLLAVGSREHQDIVYPVSELAQKYEAGVEKETPDAKEAYAPYGRADQASYRGQLDGS